MTGATGFVGGRLAAALADSGRPVRCLVRDRSKAGSLAARGLELHQGDVLEPSTLAGAGEKVDVAYYLVHSMGRGGDADFAEREQRAARNFAEMATREGVRRVVYLGGLGDEPTSKHLRSRARTAEVLAQHGPPLTYFRAGMVVGAGSESYRTLRYLVQRLPVMIAPSWLKTPTQPIAIDDVISYLSQAPEVPASIGREVQIGGPDVLSYGEMLDRMAEALGRRRRPRVPVPVLTPWLSSLWIGLITPVDAEIARPLIEGLSTATTVTDASGTTGFEVEPTPFAEALRRALAEDPEAPEHGDGTRLIAEEIRRIPPSGPLDSVQVVELVPADGVDAAPTREAVESTADSYWRYLTRRLLGLVRVVGDRDQREVVLLSRRIVLLRFRRQRYEALDEGGSVRWPIADGWLVSEEGRDKGVLSLTIERGDSPERGAPVLRVKMAVSGFYPSLRGRGRLARLGTRIYAGTQAHLHRWITRGFLRSLGRRRR